MIDEEWDIGLSDLLKRAFSGKSLKCPIENWMCAIMKKLVIKYAHEHVNFILFLFRCVNSDGTKAGI